MHRTRSKLKKKMETKEKYNFIVINEVKTKMRVHFVAWKIANIIKKDNTIFKLNTTATENDLSKRPIYNCNELEN